MAKVAVVVRQLPNYVTVVSCVIGLPTHLSIDNEDRYLQSRADQHIEEFKRQFVEFRAAQWTTQIVDVSE